MKESIIYLHHNTYINISIRKRTKSFQPLCATLYKPKKLESWQVEKLGKTSCKFIMRIFFSMNGASVGVSTHLNMSREVTRSDL
jgi:hypothetical protein